MLVINRIQGSSLMKIQPILTSYFLDQELRGLDGLALESWRVTQRHLPTASTQVRLSVLHAGLADAVEAALLEGTLPVSIAGDCCTAVGVLAGLQRAGVDPLLIWFDAHGDFNTWETTPSGFLGGMPLAMLAGLGEQTLLERNQVAPLVQERIILSDARDLDPGEAELVAGSKLTHLSDPLQFLEHPLGEGPIWVHFDTDVINPGQSPAQNYPAPGGPHPAVLTKVFRHLAATGRIQAVSMSSWAPDLPGSDRSRQVSMALLDVLLSPP